MRYAFSIVYNGWCKFSTGLRRAFLSGLQRAKSLTFPFLFYNRQIKDLAVFDWKLSVSVTTPTRIKFTLC